MSASTRFPRLSRRLVLGLLLAAACFGAQAQDYPNRPIKFIAPIAAGGLTDTFTRVLANRLSDRLGQPVVVDNRAGGGGIIGMIAAAKSPADGYNLVMVYQGVASVNPVLIPNLAYDTLRDFVPVAQVGGFPVVLVVNPMLPAKTIQEFLALARSKPGSLSYGSAGNGSTAHLTMELFKRRADLRIVHIPYRGEAPALNDLMAGQTDVVFTSLTSVLPFLGSDRIRVLGIATSTRSVLAPTLPTIAESGVPGFQSGGWYGVLAPAGTPVAVVERLNKELRAFLTEPEVKAKHASQGVEVIVSSPEALGKWIADDTAMWRKVISEAGIKAD